jgi:hypothetical protein
VIAASHNFTAYGNAHNLGTIGEDQNNNKNLQVKHKLEKFAYLGV